MLRSVLRVLFASFLVLIVSVAVVLGGHAIALSTGDRLGARVLWWVAIACLILCVIDLVMLVAVLSYQQIVRSDRRVLEGNSDRPDA